MALGLLALVATVPACAAPEVTSLGGATTVAVDGTTVTITVHIDLCCFDHVGTTLVAHIMNEVRAAQDMWNKALAKLPAHGCFDVKVVFDARLLNWSERWDAAYDQITINFDQPGRSYSAGYGAGQNEDDNTNNTEIHGGIFYASDMTTGTWAHEIGHLMGLGDDYREQRQGFHSAMSCLPGRGGTLMCNDRSGKIDQNLADRLADILNKAGLLPQCWKGTLKIASSFLAVKPNTCSDTWKLDFRVVIDAAGKASGSGINRRASPVKGGPFCGPGPLGSYQQQPYSVSGDADHVRLRLQFRESCCGSPAGAPDYSRVQMVLNESFATPRTYVIPVTAPGVAKGHFDTSFVAQTGSIDAQLECAICAGFGSKH